MIVAVYGGAFSPPHVGHAMVISWVLSTGLADTVTMVPSRDHPFGKSMAPFDDRVDFCEALVRDMGLHRGLVTVSRIEATQPAPNYSIHLLRTLRSISPQRDRFRFVMGADNLAARDRWHGFEEIIEEFAPIFVGRAGAPRPAEIMSPDFPDVSSTEIRERLRAGLPVNHLLTKSVRALCEQRRCYSDG